MTSTVLGDRTASPRPQLWRVTHRSAFQELRRSGRRVRRGTLSVVWVPPPADGQVHHPQVAFGVGRSVGGAVVRNRIRRRLRSAMRQLQTIDHVPAGTYLLGGGEALATLPWEELVGSLDDALAAVTGSSS